MGRTPEKESRIIIYAESQTERDLLRMLLAGGDYTILYFEKETNCLDNLHSIRPHLIILRTDSKEVVWRFLFALHCLQLDPRLLVISEQLQTQLHCFNSWCLLDSQKIDIDVLATRQICHSKERVVNLIGRCLEKAVNFGTKGPIIIGEDHSARQIRSILPSLKITGDPILITGEEGTGKEFTARMLMSFIDPQAVGIKVDCAAVAPNVGLSSFFSPQLVSEIIQKAKEKPVQPSTVVFMLHRIDCLNKDIQSEILGLIDDISKFMPVSDNGPNIRFIATATSDLSCMADQGLFRKDLFYRLNVIPIALPPLNRRKEDIPLLADYFVIEACVRNQKSFMALSPEIKQQMQFYPWPGNIEELRKLVQRIVITGEESVAFSKANFPKPNRNSKNTLFQPDVAALPEPLEIKNTLESLKNVSLKKICDKFISRAEKRLLQKALESTNWNRKKAAALLDISYKSMLNKMKMYEIM